MKNEEHKELFSGLSFEGLCSKSTHRVSEPRECDRKREYRHLPILLVRGEPKHT
ncbi:hypothetical protein Cfor_07006 [Coptotermes formosanus]|uniref:Uncharacterized protein n=1 Tax=Coptotermes formosanus TaxID=36987 RepID=A0A6L2Q1D2_COPFO|nr:hypothetical protein Cfor_07006 [Coptotermes formosanus]